MSTELLAGGQGVATAERLPRVGPWARRHRLWLLLAAAFVVAALAADQWQQQRELDAMTTAVQSGEEQVSKTDRYFDGVIAYYSYSPVTFRDNFPDGVREGFRTDMRRAAQDGMDGIGAATQELDGITILPWHRHLRAARTAYEQRLSLWREFLTRTTTDEGARVGPVPGFAESATAAAAALRLALPWSAGAAPRQRVEDALPSTS